MKKLYLKISPEERKLYEKRLGSLVKKKGGRFVINKIELKKMKDISKTGSGVLSSLLPILLPMGVKILSNLISPEKKGSGKVSIKMTDKSIKDLKKFMKPFIRENKKSVTLVQGKIPMSGDGFLSFIKKIGKFVLPIATKILKQFAKEGLKAASKKLEGGEKKKGPKGKGLHIPGTRRFPVMSARPFLRTLI